MINDSNNIVGLPPPNYETDDSVDANANADTTPVVINKKRMTTDDPTKQDTVTQSNTLLDQAIGAHGNSPENPEIPTGGTEATNRTIETQLSKNEFFSPSFLAAFTAIMNEVLNFNRDSRFMEAQTELTSRKRLIELAQSTSELTKMSYDLQAQQKMMEALNAFISAGVSFITLVQHAKIGAQSKDVAQKQVDAEIETQQKVVQRYDDRIKTLEDRNSGRVSNDPNAAKPLPLTPPEKAELDKIKAERAKASDRLDELVGNRENNITQRATSIQDRLTRWNDTFSDLFKSAATGVIKTIESVLTTQQGQVNAMKDIMEGYTNAERTFLDNTQKNRDQFLSNLTKTLDTLMQIVKADYQSFSFKPN